MTDLFPKEFFNEQYITPFSLLNDYAADLSENTKNQLIGIVRQKDKIEEPELSTLNYLPFVYTFEINAPTLSNFSIEILKIAYDVEIYPVYIFMDEKVFRTIGINKYQNIGFEPHIRLKDEEEFKRAIGKIFTSSYMKTVIGSLMSHIKK